jgi:hypothetical protein
VIIGRVISKKELLPFFVGTGKETALTCVGRISCLTPDHLVHFPNFKNLLSSTAAGVLEFCDKIHGFGNPVMIEIELVDDDIETLSTLLKGKQIRNLDKSLITTFDENDGIYHQALFGTITDEDNQLHHEFKIPLTNTVDATEKDNLETIENNI